MLKRLFTIAIFFVSFLSSYAQTDFIRFFDVLNYHPTYIRIQEAENSPGTSFNSNKFITYDAEEGKVRGGLIRLDPTNTVLFSTRFEHATDDVFTKTSLGQYVLAERVTATGITPLILEFNLATGALLGTWEIPASNLPRQNCIPYDMVYGYENGNLALRILTVCTDQGNQNPLITEIFFRLTGSFDIHTYQPNVPFDNIGGVYYIKFEYGGVNCLPETGFYGIGGRGNASSGFVFVKDQGTGSTEYTEHPDIQGINVNGNAVGAPSMSALPRVIALTLNSGEFTIVQKSDIGTPPTWVRSYAHPLGFVFNLSRSGKGGHGVKGNTYDYFITYQNSAPALLWYEASTGNLINASQYLFNNGDPDNGCPNHFISSSPDLSQTMAFVTERFNIISGFKLAFYNGSPFELPECTREMEFQEISPNLPDIQVPIVLNSDLDLPAQHIQLASWQIVPVIIPECEGRLPKGQTEKMIVKKSL